MLLRFKKSFLLLLLFCGCSFSDVTRVENPIDPVFIKDMDGVNWDITQAVVLFDFEAAGFTRGEGAFANRPLLNPPMTNVGDRGYPSETEMFVVIGTAVNGDPRAYPMDGLVDHTVIDDLHSGVAVALVTEPGDGTTRAYNRTINDGVLTLSDSGWSYAGRLVLYDYETGSLWYHLANEKKLTCIGGEHVKKTLVAYTATKTQWSDWKVAQPATGVLIFRGN
jgi:hypothetical protein